VDLLKQADLKQLLEPSGFPCLSLYMPTHRGGDQQQDHLLIKNMLRQAADRLAASGLKNAEVEDFLRPAQALLEDREFWQHAGDGLALFLSPGFSLSYRLPGSFKELLVIGNSFHIKPLLPLLSGDGKFYLLALSKNEARLYVGTRDAIEEVELKGVPRNMQEALWMDESERFESFHTGTQSPGGSGGERPAVFHGQNPQDEEKDNILRYFRMVDRGIQSLLNERTVPLVIAGAEFLHPIYRQASTYPGLFQEGLTGNMEEAGVKDMHARAWQLVEPLFNQQRGAAEETFRQYDGQQNGLATSDLKEAVKAAEIGQVETLFVPLGVEHWGRYEPDSHRVLVDRKPRPDSEDLLDLAARKTLLSSGQVYAVPSEELPGEGELAAILRYRL
jgi:hypothetical protein